MLKGRTPDYGMGQYPNFYESSGVKVIIIFFL